MKDQQTLNFYAREAEAYAWRYKTSEQLAPFLALLPTGARILELGSGGGQDSAAMIVAGFDVLPTDGSPELALEAEKRLGCQVQVLLFEDIAYADEFDAVWANACLLHVPRADVAAILGKIRRTLRSGGVFYASFKTGNPEGADQFGRYYNQPDEISLRAAMGSGWASIKMVKRAGTGYYNLPADWLHVTAIKA